MTIFSNRRIGGIRFIRLGPWSIQICRVRKVRPTLHDIEAIRGMVSCEPKLPHIDNGPSISLH